MTISFNTGLNRNPEIGSILVWVLLNIWRLGWVRSTKFSTNISNRTPQNTKVTAFTFSELLWGKENRRAGFHPLSPTQVKVKLSSTRLILVFLSPYSHFLQNNQSFTIPAVFGLMEWSWSMIYFYQKCFATLCFILLYFYIAFREKWFAWVRLVLYLICFLSMFSFSAIVLSLFPSPFPFGVDAFASFFNFLQHLKFGCINERFILIGIAAFM